VAEARDIRGTLCAMSRRSRAGIAKELRRRGEASYRSRSQCHGSTTKRTLCCVNQWLGFESPRLHTNRAIAFQWAFVDPLLGAQYRPDSKTIIPTAFNASRIGRSDSPSAIRRRFHSPLVLNVTSSLDWIYDMLEEDKAPIENWRTLSPPSDLTT